MIPGKATLDANGKVQLLDAKVVVSDIQDLFLIINHLQRCCRKVKKAVNWLAWDNFYYHYFRQTPR